MRRRAWRISRRFAISSEVSRHSKHCLKGHARDGREIELQLARGLSLFTAEGFISAEAARAYARARELAEQRGDRRQQFTAVYGLWQSANGAGMILECRRLSDRLLQLTAREADDGLRLQGASQRLGNLFICRRAGGRTRALRGRASALRSRAAPLSQPALWRT